MGEKLKKFKIEREPVAIKWSVREPKNIKKEEGKSRFCTNWIKPCKRRNILFNC
jgi:uncharacterized protein (DUF169 family)